ncbi:MAG: UMP kinase [Cenarchaeum sp. SB0665_bin_23]|nr:UMP kinase [Cenarchaeum sp. SB0667_bin_13]MXY61370.1 UMP kinase [Cenarchaeum sp. SB0665_bin_23]MXZ93308.1 UMP kinase [Cenarchaeum sp. SB0666_bin_15]MYB47164.1 UMP kinase [Cenarchaeum sp. SB0662_bin_33]MYC79447.1 UMP kinase [Cenarchaeum sp. SB0661_bin_35]MYD58859.1 UMP kinase [Cenarchaeum sp. SB0678_bin_8]MYG32908.1 UMP kinase [Cenarchaeum sp. SB0677_bin_16]
MERRIVVKLSGRVFGDDIHLLRDYIDMFYTINDVQPIIVAGGGATARHYINHARASGADESTLDELGIQVSRLNAKLLICAAGDRSYPHVPHTLADVKTAAESGLMVMSGGLYPGQSTNGTAALIAERVGASMFLNATDVDGVYDSDPNIHKDAKIFKTITISKLQDILINNTSIAGGYDLLDIIALKTIQRSLITTRIIRATPDNLENILRHKKTDIGTLIQPD